MSRPGPAPAPLVAAVGLTLLEALVLAGYALSVIPALDRTRLTMGLTSLAFFWGYAGFLAFCAWRLLRLQSWARAPLVLAQLIQIMLGISFWGGATTLVGVSLVVVGAVALAGVFHPASLAALAQD